MDPALLEYLQKLGLTEYQAKAMLALYSRNDSNAKDVSETAKIPYTKVYDILESLENKGLVSYTLGKPRMYRAVDAEFLINSLLKKQKEFIADAEAYRPKELMELRHLQLESESKTLHERKAWIVQTSNGVISEKTKLVMRSKEKIECVFESKLWYDNFTKKQHMVETHDMVVKQKVALYLIFPKNIDCYEVAKRGLASGWLQLRDWKAFFELSHVHLVGVNDKLVNNSFLVFDEKELLLPFKDPQGNFSGGIIINDASISKGMSQFYRSLFELGEPFNETFSNGVRKGAQEVLKKKNIF